jgi:hypothetical protein
MITIMKPEEQHQHLNGGGWVANTAKVADTAYIGSNAQVYGNAQVSGDARVSGDAQVSGDARVSGGAWETSPLYIQGTRHAVTNSSYGFLNIGCIKLSFSEWKKKYRAVGKQQGYTVEQIKEYGTIIAFATKLGKKEKHGK